MGVRKWTLDWDDMDIEPILTREEKVLHEKVDAIESFMKDVLDHLFGEKELDEEGLYNSLEEICAHLELKMPKGELMVKRKYSGLSKNLHIKDIHLSRYQADKLIDHLIDVTLKAYEGRKYEISQFLDEPARKELYRGIYQ